jgi:hypothetical protein
MQHHMNDFGEDLDGVKRRLTDFDKADKLKAAAVLPRVEVPPAAQASTVAVLLNKGAPLLDNPPSSGQAFHTTPSTPHQDCEPFKVRPPKHNWDFYFRAPGSLVVLSFPQPLNFSSVFPSL